MAGYFVSRADQAGNGRSYGMEIVGEKGRIGLNGGANRIALFEQDVWVPWEGDQGWTPLACEILPLGEGNRLAIRDLIEAIEQDREPIASARHAVGALEMIHGAYWAQITGKQVAFPLTDRTHPLARLKGEG
jgi:predicted dehydrogenase